MLRVRGLSGVLARLKNEATRASMDRIAAADAGPRPTGARPGPDPS